MFANGCEEELGCDMKNQVNPSTNTNKDTAKDLPLVSVLIPAYNHESFVEQAVRSVWNQSYKNLEIIMIDDGSSDNTGLLAHRLQEESPIRMKVLSRENNGLCKTLNECLSLANGEWIALLASDDFYHPEFISENMKMVLAERNYLVAVHCDAVQVDEVGRFGAKHSEVTTRPPYSGKCFYDLVHKRGRIVASTLFTSMEMFKQLSGFDDALVAEDYDLHLRISRIATFKYIPKALVYKRYLKTSLGRQPWRWAAGNVVALRKHADLLGESLPKILGLELGRLSMACFSQGAVMHGLKLGRESIKKMDSNRDRVAILAKILVFFPFLITRYVVWKSIPHVHMEKMRKLKRFIRCH